MSNNVGFQETGTQVANFLYTWVKSDTGLNQGVLESVSTILAAAGDSKISILVTSIRNIRAVENGLESVYTVMIAVFNGNTPDLMGWEGIKCAGRTSSFVKFWVGSESQTHFFHRGGCAINILNITAQGCAIAYLARGGLSVSSVVQIYFRVSTVVDSCKKLNWIQSHALLDGPGLSLFGENSKVVVSVVSLGHSLLTHQDDLLLNKVVGVWNGTAEAAAAA